MGQAGGGGDRSGADWRIWLLAMEAGWVQLSEAIAGS
jgi:hypothetical protein